MLGCVLCYFIIDKFPRKKMMFLTETLSLGFAIILFFLFSCKEQCSSRAELFQTVGLFCFRFMITVTYSYFCMIQYEIFPNQVRGSPFRGQSSPVALLLWSYRE